MARKSIKTISTGMAKLLGTSEALAIKPLKNDFAVKMKKTPAGEVAVILIPEFKIGSLPMKQIRLLAKEPRMSIPSHLESLGYDTEARIIYRGGHGCPVIQTLDDEMTTAVRYIQMKTAGGVSPTGRVHERRPI